MKTFLQIVLKAAALVCLLLTLSACKIDLSIIGIGTVKTDTDSIDCTTGTTGDCHQEYVTDLNDCDDPAHCTLVSGEATETFTALPGDDNTFGGWGDLCFGIADVKCQHTITDEYAADQNGQLNVTATFDSEATPQSATYTFNHLGQRISKTVAGVKTYFVYSDIDGQMLGEYTATGTPIREYIYLEGERVAMYDYTGVEPKDSTNNKAIVYLHNDHIGQTHIGMNSDGQFIYERIQTPFGETMSEMNVYNVQVPVRFPGQYYDSESGFSQNWNRDYDSSIGRYVQSDPIGLRGGINTFGYVGGNPVMNTDQEGLRWQNITRPPGSTASRMQNYNNYQTRKYYKDQKRKEGHDRITGPDSPEFPEKPEPRCYTVCDEDYGMCMKPPDGALPLGSGCWLVCDNSPVVTSR